jgi:hypothetical protein
MYIKIQSLLSARFYHYVFHVSIIRYYYSEKNDEKWSIDWCYLILDSRMMNIKIAFIYKKFKES